MGKKQGSDYQVFGMQMPGRSFQSDEYRYGFNGMESDDEIKGEGNSYTTEFRQYDPRLGRWLSLDPLAAQFPWQSPYVAFDNNPIYFKDPKGLAAEGGGDPVEVEGVDYSQSVFNGMGGSNNNIQAPSTQTYEINQNTTPMEQMPLIEYSVGQYLVDMINDLPSKSGYASTTFETYRKSTEVESPGGYCYVCSMSRTDKAYSDMYDISPLPLSSEDDKKLNHYKYSASRGKGLNEDFLGYGVGGALMDQGLGEPVNDDDFWNDGLKPGAQIQYWNKKEGVQTKNDVVSKLSQNQSLGGHSVIFMGYGEDDEGPYIKYSDYGGNQSWNKFRPSDTQYMIFYGVNLKAP